MTFDTHDTAEEIALDWCSYLHRKSHEIGTSKAYPPLSASERTRLSRHEYGWVKRAKVEHNNDHTLLTLIL